MKKALLVTLSIAIVAGLGLLGISLNAPYEGAVNYSEAELERRAVASHPDWANYEEDLKADLGARAVAEWEGRPRRLRLVGSGIEVDFSIEGAWANRTFAIPILLRDNIGHMRRNTSVGIRDGLVTYGFEQIYGTDRPDPVWIELRYPDAEQRFVLDTAGQWAANEPE